jgi:hypothetical protein
MIIIIIIIYCVFLLLKFLSLCKKLYVNKLKQLNQIEGVTILVWVEEFSVAIHPNSLLPPGPEHFLRT